MCAYLVDGTTTPELNKRVSQLALGRKSLSNKSYKPDWWTASQASVLPRTSMQPERKPPWSRGCFRSIYQN